MKKKGILSVFLAVIAAISCFGCGGETATYVSLEYGTGVNDSGKVYDKMYYRNTAIVNGADPGVMWVSEEQDPEYGGYFYVYTSSEKWYGNTVYSAGCFRSKDLSNWENAGAVANGHALESAPDDWTKANFWAPECIYDAATRKYYLYYSAQRESGERGSSVATNYSNLTVAVASSDTPVGPFTLVRSGTDCNGEEITNAPRFDVSAHFGLSKPFATIDASVFRDDDGSLYLTFAKHEDTSGRNRGIWGVKLLDPVTPDWSTLTCLTVTGKRRVVDFEAGVLTDSVVPVGEGNIDESTLNEGNFIFKAGGKYYLTFSTNGYGDKGYNVMQAVSDSPLGPYVKPEIGKGNPVISSAAAGIGYMSGTGHHSMVKAGDEIFSVYAYHGNPDKFSDAQMRILGTDRIVLTEIDGQQVLACNGPTYSPQYLPESISGYKNLAPSATVEVNGGENKGYLTDGLLSVSGSLKDREYRSSGTAEITLKFASPVRVSGIMIYNSTAFGYAFKKIDRIDFKFAEKREVNGKLYDYGTITDLLFPTENADENAETLIQGSAAIADFKEITVTEITVTVSQKYVNEDKFGAVNANVGIAEIVVLGK